MKEKGKILLSAILGENHAPGKTIQMHQAFLHNIYQQANKIKTNACNWTLH